VKQLARASLGNTHRDWSFLQKMTKDKYVENGFLWLISFLS